MSMSMSKTYTVMINPSTINFRPLTVLEEIFQNINTILSTVKFSVPLFREFGTNAVFIDKPMTTIRPTLIAEIIEVVEKYESRVIVEEIKMSGEIDGQLYPIVIISIRNGVKL